MAAINADLVPRNAQLVADNTRTARREIADLFHS
jgi:hypothetical protein